MAPIPALRRRDLLFTLNLPKKLVKVPDDQDLRMPFIATGD